MPFRRDFYTNVKKLEQANTNGANDANWPKKEDGDSESSDSDLKGAAAANKDQTSRKVPEPAKKFADACLPRYLLEQLQANGITEPSPI